MSPARAIIVLVILLSGMLYTYAGPRLDLPKPRVLDVRSCPRRMDDWVVVDEPTVPADVQKALPTAVIVDRVYRNEKGRSISLLLLTARDMRDIHSPAVCLPGSGWQTRSDRLLVMHGQKITARVMTARDTEYLVWFWYPRVPYPEPTQPLVRALYRWRLQAPGTYRPDTIADLSTSLLVRVIVPAGPGAENDLRRFVAILQPRLDTLIEAGLRRRRAVHDEARRDAESGRRHASGW